jgi:transcriptional regulator with XRE-family HTH domain
MTHESSDIDNVYRRMREDIGVTQRQVCEFLDWSQSRLSRIERGLYEPTKSEQQALEFSYQALEAAWS